MSWQLYDPVWAAVRPLLSQMFRSISVQAQSTSTQGCIRRDEKKGGEMKKQWMSWNGMAERGDPVDDYVHLYSP